MYSILLSCVKKEDIRKCTGTHSFVQKEMKDKSKIKEIGYPLEGTGNGKCVKKKGNSKESGNGVVGMRKEVTSECNFWLLTSN